MEIFSLFHLAFVGVVALFPPVNPLGTALIMDPLLKPLDATGGRKAASFRIALNCFMLCVCTVLVGSWIFKLFGISLPVVQFAGGILICKMGWTLLSSNDSEDASGKGSQESSQPDAQKNVEGLLFYPMAFPMTTGAGTISVLLTLSARGHEADARAYVFNLLGLFLAVLITAVMIYLSYAYTPMLLKRLGARGEQIVNRLSAFLVFCVGIQIASEGLTALVRSGIFH